MIDAENFIKIIQEAISTPTVDQSDLSKSKIMSVSDDQISSFSSDKLCSIIATNRYIKIGKDLEIKAMQELSNRRINGDNFDFESKIEEYGKRFMPLNFDAASTLTSALNFVRGKK